MHLKTTSYCQLPLCPHKILHLLLSSRTFGSYWLDGEQQTKLQLQQRDEEQRLLLTIFKQNPEICSSNINQAFNGSASISFIVVQSCDPIVKESVSQVITQIITIKIRENQARNNQGKHGF